MFVFNFHFVFLNTSLKTILVTSIPPTERGHYVKKIETFIVSLLWIWIACMQCIHWRIPGLHKFWYSCDCKRTFNRNFSQFQCIYNCSNNCSNKTTWKYRLKLWWHYHCIDSAPGSNYSGQGGGKPQSFITSDSKYKIVRLKSRHIEKWWKNWIPQKHGIVCCSLWSE